MQYHAPTNKFTIEACELAVLSVDIRYVIKKIRQASNFPLDGCSERPRVMTDACHAEATLLRACKNLGIDLGADRPGKLDVRDAG